MDDKTLVEQLRLEAQNVSEASKLMAQAKSRRQGDGPPRDDLYSWVKPEQTIQWKAATRIEALEADNARARAQGQDEGFAAAVQELRDMSARKPLPTLWHAASVLADSLEQSRIPCQALESKP